MDIEKPNQILYRLAQGVSWLVSTFIFGRRVIRNEIRGIKGPFVVVANHECALDFVNLIGLSSRPMRFVISRSFYNTLPVRGIMSKLGVIPKQQFQTKPSDLRTMKRVVEAGEPLVIYPAGLMCEDGLSTPIPSATYRFIRWLGVDVYAARTTGAYFVMPKWAKKIRPGRTNIDVYKLIDSAELISMSDDELRFRVEDALLFDAYREEENENIVSDSNCEIEGLENVLYMCPTCDSECSTETLRDRIRCRICGFEERSDRRAMLYKCSGPGDELRYVSDWSRYIREKTRTQIQSGKLAQLEGKTKIQLLNVAKKKFVDAGEGILHLSRGGFKFSGHLHGKDTALHIPIVNIPTIPFKPGKHIELQHGDTIYRCLMENSQLMMKYVNMVELFYELDHA